MTLNKAKPTADIGSHRDSPEYDIDNPVFTSNIPNTGSQIKEPNILVNQNTVGSSTQTPTTNIVSSATSDSTKNYIGGGTTPNSDIIVNKPKPNYTMFVLLGVVTAYVFYKVFFNKKSE